MARTLRRQSGGRCNCMHDLHYAQLRARDYEPPSRMYVTNGNGIAPFSLRRPGRMCSIQRRRRREVRASCIRAIEIAPHTPPRQILLSPQGPSTNWAAGRVTWKVAQRSKEGGRRLRRGRQGQNILSMEELLQCDFPELSLRIKSNAIGHCGRAVREAGRFLTCPPSALVGQIRQIEEGSVSGSS